MTSWIDEGRTVGVASFDCSKAFNTVSSDILKSKPEKGLHKSGLRSSCTGHLRGLWVKTQPSVRPVASRVHQHSVLSQVLLNIFDNDLDEGTEHLLNEFAEDAKLGQVANTPECNWDEWLIPVSFVLSVRNMWTGWRGGQKPLEIQQRQAQGLALWEEYRHAPAQSWVWPAGR